MTERHFFKCKFVNFFTTTISNCLVHVVSLTFFKAFILLVSLIILWKYTTPVFLKWCKSWKRWMSLTFAPIVSNLNKNILWMYIFLKSPSFKLSDDVKMKVISGFYKKLIFFFFIFLHVLFNIFSKNWLDIKALSHIFPTVPNLWTSKYSSTNDKQNKKVCIFTLNRL